MPALREPMKAMSRTALRVPLDDRILRWWFRRAEVHALFGITVRIAHGTAGMRATCLRKIEAALRLIHDYDPRRLRRIERDIDGIFVYKATGDLGCFHFSIRLVTLRSDYVLSPSNSAAEIASTLVHEGTHARLRALGFDYAPERRARIEAICHRSEIAFARRVPDSKGLVEGAEWRLALDPSEWGYQALQQRQLQELAELGASPRVIALLERIVRQRDRLIMRIWKGAPPHGH